MSRSPRPGERIWTVEIALTEEGGRTRADARLRHGEQELTAWGRSRRNPTDPDVPLVGEELAVARALADLSHQLFLAALDAIDELEPPPAGGGRPLDARGLPDA